jgi:hypothetical protein
MARRPSHLAIRAVNQYRRRDVVPYLALRYYLENSAARTSQWIQQVAVDLLLRRSEPSYLRAQHFKDIDERGTVGHRDMFLPGPNEALVEAALIDACATAGGPFQPPHSVYSYQPAKGAETSGVFVPYMQGLKARHRAISEACKRQPDSRVALFDIKRFYPSIRVELARPIWLAACQDGNLPPRFREVGDRLLTDHGIASNEQSGRILTGPMFSHLIGNLFLKQIDIHLAQGPAQYFRYVDDIALVGSPAQIRRSLHLLSAQVEALDLELHDEHSSKTLNVSAAEWLEGEQDWSDSRASVSWMSLVGDLKRFLLWHPTQRDALEAALKGEGFRIPVPDYSGAVREAAFVDRLGMLLSKTWFQAQAREVTVSSILRQAHTLRRQYDEELSALVETTRTASSFAFKRVLPKARYRLGRLAYLAEPERLRQIGHEVRRVPGLTLQAEVAIAVGTGEMDRVLALGANAVQAAAQPLRMAPYASHVSRPLRSKLDTHSLAILFMNGAVKDLPLDSPNDDELLKFAVGGSDQQLMRSRDPFIREVACLHGIADRPRHKDLLDTAFDAAEEIALDAIEQTQQSLSI